MSANERLGMKEDIQFAMENWISRVSPIDFTVTSIVFAQTDLRFGKLKIGNRTENNLKKIISLLDGKSVDVNKRQKISFDTSTSRNEITPGSGSGSGRNRLKYYTWVQFELISRQHLSRNGRRITRGRRKKGGRRRKQNSTLIIITAFVIFGLFLWWKSNLPAS